MLTQLLAQYIHDSDEPTETGHPTTRDGVGIDWEHASPNILASMSHLNGCVRETILLVFSLINDQSNGGGECYLFLGTLTTHTHKKGLVYNQCLPKTNTQTQIPGLLFVSREETQGKYSEKTSPSHIHVTRHKIGET